MSRPLAKRISVSSYQRALVSWGAGGTESSDRSATLAITSRALAADLPSRRPARLGDQVPLALCLLFKSGYLDLNLHARIRKPG